MNKDQLFDNITSRGNNALLERRRINDLLATATKSLLVVVTAGVGYGKTRAVQSFLRDYDVGAVWMQMSEGDNSKSRFWEHFCHSIGKYSEKLGAKLTTLGIP
jgi:LuxR family maltose regulon positive regulatory protein